MRKWWGAGNEIGEVEPKLQKILKNWILNLQALENQPKEQRLWPDLFKKNEWVREMWTWRQEATNNYFKTMSIFKARNDEDVEYNWWYEKDLHNILEVENRTCS